MRVLIVDDEPLARERLRELLRAEPQLEILPDPTDFAEAVEAIEARKPELVLLDVEMPGGTGFDLIREVGPERFPAVIFVTAFDEYAVDAFEWNALDYLVKPVRAEPLRRALDRVRSRLECDSLADLSERLAKAVEERKGSRRHPPRVRLPKEGGFELLPVREIDWIEADAKFVKLHTRGRTHVVRGMLGRFEARLDPTRFVRIHRSAIVNLDRVARFEWSGAGAHSVVLRDGTRLPIARGNRTKVYGLAGIEP